MLRSSEWARRGDSTATLPMASHKSDTSTVSSEETQTDSEPFRSSEVPGFDEADSAQPGTKRGPQSSGPATVYLKRPKRPGSVIGLRELIEAGFLEPGKDVLSLVRQATRLLDCTANNCKPGLPGKGIPSFPAHLPHPQTYKQVTQLASLEPDGAITTHVGDEQLRFEVIR